VVPSSSPPGPMVEDVNVLVERHIESTPTGSVSRFADSTPAVCLAHAEVGYLRGQTGSAHGAAFRADMQEGVRGTCLFLFCVSSPT
jgi:hypothetical protein